MQQVLNKHIPVKKL